MLINCPSESGHFRWWAVPLKAQWKADCRVEPCFSPTAGISQSAVQMSSTGDSCNSLTSKLITELLWRFILGKLISFHKRLQRLWKMTNCGHRVMWRTKQPALISAPCLQGSEEQKGREIEEGENWARTSDTVMKPSSAPVGSSSDEPHRWFGQIKTLLGYEDQALNEGIHFVVCQSLSWNCNMENILKSCSSGFWWQGVFFDLNPDGL